MNRIFIFVCALTLIKSPSLAQTTGPWRLYECPPNATAEQCVLHASLATRGFCIEQMDILSKGKPKDTIVACVNSNAPLILPKKGK